MKHLLFVAALSCSMAQLCAQMTASSQNNMTESYSDKLEDLFEQLNLQTLNPPNLYDYGLPLGNFPDHNGTADVNKLVSPSLFGACYASVYGMYHANGSGLPQPDVAYTNIMKNADSNDTIPLLALHYEYNRFKATAMDDGLIDLINDQFYDVSGPNETPYEVMESFVATPAIQQLKNQFPWFSVSSSQYFGNTGNVLTGATIDFDNGQGLQSVNLDTPFQVSYSSSGQKNILIRYNFSNAPSVECYGRINVAFSNTTNLLVDGNFDFVATKTDLPSNEKVDIYVDYNCNSDGLQKPLIYVEGFNPSTLGEDFALNTFDFSTKFDYVIDVEGINKSLYFDILNDEGYDMVYIDYHDGGAAIQDNAGALIEAIKWINDQKALNGSTEPNVLIGESMGGLVSKYALREMELANEDHDTEVFLTLDSPMQGANIPISFQCLARDVPHIGIAALPDNYDELQDFVPETAKGQELLNTTAARQMLMFQTPSLFSPQTLPSLFFQFQAELQGMGDLQACREVAVTNGRQDGASQGFQPYSTFIDLDENTGNNWFDGAIRLKLNALPSYNTTMSKVYELKIVVTILNSEINLHDNELSVINSRPLDTSPGGYYPLPSTAELLNDSEIDISSLPPELGEFLGVNLLDQSNFCFIPAVSSIDLTASSNPYFDISDNLALVANGSTHYQNYIGETAPDDDGISNHRHTWITDRNAQLIRFEMTGSQPNIGSTLAQDFNFGESVKDGINFLNVNHYRTVKHLKQDLTVDDANLYINAGERVGFTANMANPDNLTQNHWNFLVSDSPCEAGFGLDLLIENGSLFKIGDRAAGIENTVDLNLKNNVNLVVDDSNMLLAPNSSLHVQNTSLINIQNNSTVDIEENAIVHIYDGATLRLAGSTLILRDGAQLIIHDGAFLFTDGGTMRVEDGASVTLEEGGVLYYEDLNLELAGAEAKLALGGHTNVADNQVFTFTDGGASQGGYIELLDDGYWGERFSFGANSEFFLEGNDPDDLILKGGGQLWIASSAFVLDGVTYPSQNADRIELRNGRVSHVGRIVGGTSYFKAVDVQFDHTDITLFDTHFIDRCIFKHNEIKALLFYYGTTTLKIDDSEFLHSRVYVEGRGYRITDSDGEDLQIISTALTTPSLLRNVHINGNVSNPSSHICEIVDDSNVELSIDDCSFEGVGDNDSGLNLSSNGQVTKHSGTLKVKCSSFEHCQNAAAIYAASCTVSMSTQDRSGYNYFANNYANIEFDRALAFLVDDGHNEFYVDNTQGATYPCMFGTINRQCKNTIYNPIIKANHNSWSVWYPDNGFGYAGPPHENSINPPNYPEEHINITYGQGAYCGSFHLVDTFNDHMACGTGGGGNNIPTKSASIDGKGSENNEKTGDESAPLIYTETYNGWALDSAIFDAMIFDAIDSISTDPLLSIEKLNEILTYPQDNIDSNYHYMLDYAYEQIKFAFGAALSEGVISKDLNQSNFQPAVAKYVETLMARSTDAINPDNYVSQFQLELDKASMFRGIGKTEMAYLLVSNLDNCPVDSTEQALVNRQKASLQSELFQSESPLIQILQDSTGFVLDSTLFVTPEIQPQNDYFFGAHIYGINSVSFTNCGLVTWRDQATSENQQQLEVYPNPSNGLVTFTKLGTPSKGSSSVMILDLSGKVVAQVSLDLESSSQQIDLSELSNGVYYYHLLDKGQQKPIVGKLILLK